jgi:hypothetical protein
VQIQEEKQPENRLQAVISAQGKILECNDDGLRSRLEIILRRIVFALFPIPSMMGCLDECSHDQH